MIVTWECRISKLLMMPGRKGKLGRSHIQSYIHIEEGLFQHLSIYLSIYTYIFAIGLESLKSLKIYIQSVFLFVFHFD